ncbi:2-amino-4-hydroxy-6-hydroxymethyldihydropteridine diphosphokinase [Candidatus Liberibacter africanus]|uniref:2-amino-4-hydroxy-6-hydroxymethyldihydropteridine pyrophosphokinase n=1 Tax=Candidatus Liberibacter africanus PTSAPSY TaxID=1277257 RepID=A0A0G3I9Z4_LIBAF|nr:2-amino-4-hydroxy-6-hydroxymethyldihydropteridine diphosphokinase [Candidatus Liberibacter africanus]AKK20632.1 2-amino-4-hydroxy-6-hydroxymethyldihydropteridine pyrophosphokinase [Candidatus Liberibacter africanus PTSAPSY]QTP64314.1 2-amino-4-hydroxy-6-hydroxymethyldihydropteridine diphosphokinase [Candidatus Liberibacter africanus]
MNKKNDTIAIGLGSNIGNKKKYIAQALQLLNNHKDCEVISVSRLYHTPPWGKNDQDFFFNAVSLIKTRVSPNELLDILLSIENKLNRKRDVLWGSRTIDLDILILGDYVCATDRLTIPHPYITERAFVIAPLSDVAPDIVIKGLSVKKWFDHIDVSKMQVIDDSRDWWIDCD